MEYTVEQQSLLEKFEELIKSTGSQNKACALVGISPQIATPLRKGTYEGDTDKQFKTLAAYFDIKAESSKAFQSVDYAPIGTSNLVYQTIRNIQVMGGFGVVVGDPGVGKTKAIMKYAADNPTSCIYFEAGACIKGLRAVLKQIARILGLPLSSSIDDMFYNITNKLHDGMVIVIDEAQHLTFDAIEAVREISDYFDKLGQTCGVVLIGNEGISQKLNGSKTSKNYRQTNGRRWQMQELSTKNITVSDIRLVFPQVAEQTDVVRLLHVVAQADYGLRAAVKLFVQAYNMGNYDFDGLVATAKIIGLNLPNLNRVVKTA